MSTKPARILGLAGGTLAVGSEADVVVIDPERTWVYDPAVGFSKSRNSPWAGCEMQGRVRAVWVAGRRVHDADAAGGAADEDNRRDANEGESR
jgi:dihydroorotase